MFGTNDALSGESLSLWNLHARILAGTGEERTVGFSVISPLRIRLWVWGSKKWFASEVGYQGLGPKQAIGKRIPSANMGSVLFLEGGSVPDGALLCVSAESLWTRREVVILDPKDFRRGQLSECQPPLPGNAAVLWGGERAGRRDGI